MQINDFEMFRQISNNYDSITVRRGRDGFGSQLYAIIIGYIATQHINKKYYYSNFSDLTVPLRNNSINLNNLLESLMKNLNIENVLTKNINESCLQIQLPYACVNQDSFLKNNLKKLQDAWPLKKPNYLENNHNICIHVRRGIDVNKNDKHRWQDSSFYENMLKILFSKYPNSKIHIFSWGDPGLSHIENKNLIIHNSDGYDFVDDYNALVHTDILVVAGSTYSISAAFFNKNLVLCSNDIVKFNSPDSMNCKKAPFPIDWENNYNKILK